MSDSVNTTEVHQEVQTVVQPNQSEKKAEKSFENQEADNPLASKRLSLADKIREHAKKVDERKKKEAESAKKPQKEAKKTVVEDTPTQDDLGPRDASAVATTKPKKQPAPKPKKEEVAPEENESDFENLATTADGLLEQEQEITETVDETPPWEPNFKFKYTKFDQNMKDGRAEVEAEIPEHFRELIKDADTEKELRELFEKAHGLDYVKETRNKTRSERDNALKYIEGVRGRLKGLEDSIMKGDLDTVFSTMAIPEEKVLNWVLDKINYSQLEPGQRQLIDAQREAEKRARAAEQSQQAMFQSHMQAMVKHKAIALDAILERPDLKAVISAYDNRPGRNPTDPTFRDLVANHGELTWHRSGGKIDLSPQEAVEAVLREYGIAAAYGPKTKPTTQATTPSQQVAGANTGGAQTTARPKSTALPNVSGRATSPTKPRPRTMKELMEIRKQVLSQ